MKKFKSFIAIVLMSAMLFSLNVMFDGLADPGTGLNGSTCYAADFDKSVYTDVANDFDVCNNKYQWPSSGTVLVEASGSNWSVSDFNGITIPANLIVDIYKYYKFAGDADTTYKLVAHFDTTDGNTYTIGSSSSNVSSDNTAIASNPPSTSNGSNNKPSNSHTGGKKWGTVTKTFKAGTPSASYKNSYNDVPADMWCYDAIMTMTDGGLLNGYGGGVFGPNDPLTRAQLAIIRTRMGGKLTSNYKESTFDGYAVFQDNATASRAWAAIVLAGKMQKSGNVYLTNYELSLVEPYKNSLLTGYAKTQYGTAGRMSWTLYDAWRASLSKNLTYRASIDEFPDADAIHKWIDENADIIAPYLLLRGSHAEKVEWCENYFLRAYNLGMFRGVDAEGTFNPYGPLTRGQLCQALYNVGWTYEGCIDYRTFAK